MSILNKLFKSRNVVLEMLELRGYTVDKYKNFSLTELDIKIKNVNKKTSFEPNMIDIECINSKQKKIIVKYILTKIRTSNIKNLIDEMIENDVISDNDDLVFIIKDKVNNMELFESLFDLYLNSNNIFIQLFSIDSLQVNITKHTLVPELKILTKEEIDELKDILKITDLNQFPKFIKSDPQAKFCGVRPGNVCKIIRTSETSGFYINYRYLE